MPTTLFTEQDNAAGLTSPFTCWTPCTTPEGVEVLLGRNLVLSVHIASARPTWLDSVAQGTVRLATAEDGVWATCLVVPGGVSPIYNLATLCVIGAMTFGDAVDNYADSATYVFPDRTVYINADSVMVLNTDKVLSLVDAQGNHAAGRVTLAEGPGALIQNIGGNTLRVGFPFPAGNSSLLKYLVLQVYKGTLFNISYSDGSITLDYAGNDLDTVCASKKGSTLPDENGNLPVFPYTAAVAPTPTPELPPATEGELLHQIVIPIANAGGYINITPIPLPEKRTRLTVNQTGASVITLSLLG